ncbi:hypothetical protein HCG49_13405 [Arenibacter sp. 6A1]|uniref:metallophosphoesterase n=1 Tax=Arenibacter sp. 6A1 TaxID=2720391 RepID=UPI0014462072|nr:metallophosphoesterase [Arenibacter sp. 6A1]NKI27561.1 hypothetical protein [Arenibacter sp. 6A1]
MEIRKLLVVLLIGQLTFFTNYGQQNQDKMFQTDKYLFSIGVIADCQYCNIEGTGVRKYSSSKEKLELCVTHFNTLDLTYTIHLGDFIDRDWENFDVVTPIYNKLLAPRYHVLGNHDFSVSDDKKAKVPSKLGMPAAYYDFEVKGWRFIVLNGNDISFHAHAKGSREYNFATTYYSQNKISSPKWNGAIGEKQMNWLKTILEKASKEDEKVILYCHFPVYPENIHNLWNAHEVIALLEKYPVVKAYINGHNHEGNYGIKNGIHYLTFKGMVDTEETSYGVLKLFTDHLEVKGYGREGDKILQYKP